MKIALVTGCLEPGRDGVGDYTRTLAAECVRCGHDVALISLAEKTRSGEMGREPVPTLRLTPAEWRADGGRAARAWIEAFGADWASLQFVPYSFDPRGLFGASLAPLAHLLGGARRRHVFFHEIWIGSNTGAAWKSRLVGYWQRRTVGALVRRLAPAGVHTSTHYHCAALATLGVAAAWMPVFGSVPAGEPGRATLPGVATDALVCGHFGTLHPGWAPDDFVRDFAAFAAARGRPAAFVAAGSLGYGAARFEELAAAWRGRVAAVALGRLATAELARVFARFDCAATSVPWNILGKSSTVAALREHGVRVVVTDPGDPPRFAARLDDDTAGDPGFVPYFRDRGLPPMLTEKTAPRPGAAAVARQFLAALHAAR